jgi:hypothetical protein
MEAGFSVFHQQGGPVSGAELLGFNSPLWATSYRGYIDYHEGSLPVTRPSLALREILGLQPHAPHMNRDAPRGIELWIEDLVRLRRRRVPESCAKGSETGG